ncbi:MAG: hypothetical protein WC480_03790 [Patescibacteria group bacterium]
MTKKAKELVILVSIVTIILVVIGFLKFVYFSPNPENKLSCKFPVRVASDLLEPDVNKGAIVMVDKCYSKTDLQFGNVVVFKDQDGTMLMRYFLKFNEAGDKIDLVRRLTDSMVERTIGEDQISGVISLINK